VGVDVKSRIFEKLRNVRTEGYGQKCEKTPTVGGVALLSDEDESSTDA
jgi:hypothetical protein